MHNSIASRPGRGSAQVTLKQIALELGVSHQLVSFALNDTGTVGDEMRARIKETAAEMGYRRNGSAMAMKSGRFGNVALLLSTKTTVSTLPQQTWNGVHDELAAHDLHLTMTRLPDEKLSDAGQVPKVLRELSVDGLIIDYTHHIPRAMLDLVSAGQMPAIWLNSQQEADCVFADDLEAGRRATRHLLESGHRRITFLNFASVPDDAGEHYSARERQSGYLETMKRAGQAPRVLLRQEVSFERKVAHLTALLQEPNHPTALVTYGDEEAEFALLAARDLGRAVPTELSLISLSTARSVLGHQLTSFCVPEFEMGQGAARLLRQKIAAPAIPLAPLVLAFGFEMGRTCAPPRL